MKFDKSIHKTARELHSTRSGNPDCGVLHHYETGGDISINQEKVPPLLGLQIPIPYADRPSHKDPSSRIHTSNIIEAAFTAYAPGILIATEKPFPYAAWDDKNGWVQLLKERRLVANGKQRVQVKLKNEGEVAPYVVNLFYCTASYVRDPSRWVRLQTVSARNYAKLEPAVQNGSYLRAAEEFELFLPGPGNYILIARYAKVDEPLPTGIIDAEAYNRTDSWSFLPLSC